MNKKLLGLGLGAMLVAGSVPASADVIGFQGSDTDGREAEVYFEVNGSTLTVTLSNTSEEDVLEPVDVLVGVFFNLAGSPTLTPVSALLPSGSAVIFPPATQTPYGDDDVSPEWAYETGLNQYGAGQAIGAAGWGIFEDNDRFDTSTNLQGPTGVGGLQYGILSAGDDNTTGNEPVTGGSGGNPVALVQDTIIFTLVGLPEGFTIDDISDITFQYGTSLTEPSTTGECITCEPCPDCPDPNDPVAEPATLALFGIGLAGLAKRAASKR